MIDKTRPLSPQQVAELRVAQMPPAVFEAVNELLATHLNEDGEACFYACEVVQLISDKLSQKSPHAEMTHDERCSQIALMGWLHFEDAYRNCGWNVSLEMNNGEGRFFVFRDQDRPYIQGVLPTMKKRSK